MENRIDHRTNWSYAGQQYDGYVNDFGFLIESYIHKISIYT